MVDFLSPEASLQGWGGKTDSKLPWDKDPDFCESVRGGLPVENVLSIQTARENQRMRRLVGPPFAKKFLADQEQIFKDCTKAFIASVEDRRKRQNNIVDILLECKKYAFDIISLFPFKFCFLTSSRVRIWRVFQGRFRSIRARCGRTCSRHSTRQRRSSYIYTEP